MAEFENENDGEFWSDDLFMSSQDPISRDLEKRRHPDTGKRVRIVDSNVVEVIKVVMVDEVSKKIQKETRIVAGNQESFGLN